MLVAAGADYSRDQEVAFESHFGIITVSVLPVSMCVAYMLGALAAAGAVVGA